MAGLPKKQCPLDPAFLVTSSFLPPWLLSCSWQATEVSSHTSLLEEISLLGPKVSRKETGGLVERTAPFTSVLIRRIWDIGIDV